MSARGEIDMHSDQATRSATRRRVTIALIVIAFAMVFSACAAGVNPSVDVPASDGDLAGFWTGLWQGIILPFTFIVSLFSDTVGVYEIHNTGGWYDFGFVLGAGTFLGGSGSRAKRRNR